MVIIYCEEKIIVRRVKLKLFFCLWLIGWMKY